MSVDELKRQSKNFVQLREKAVRELGDSWPLANLPEEKKKYIKKVRRLSVEFFKLNYRIFRSTCDEKQAFEMAKRFGFHFAWIPFYF